jgi:hypothetical protein
VLVQFGKAVTAAVKPSRGWTPPCGNVPHCGFYLSAVFVPAQAFRSLASRLADPIAELGIGD